MVNRKSTPATTDLEGLRKYTSLGHETGDNRSNFEDDLDPRTI